MIIAMCSLYSITGKKDYLDEALRIDSFIAAKVTEGDILYVGYRDGVRSGKGFLDEYAFYSAALISLYGVIGDQSYLDRVVDFCSSADKQFWDDENGGYFFGGRENEKLIISQKEIYDTALPSGNSVMAFVLVRLYQLTGDGKWRERADSQFSFLSGQADYPAGQTMFLISLLYDKNPPPHITVVCGEDELPDEIISKLPMYSDCRILNKQTDEYSLLNDKTAYYICKGNVCLPPVNDPNEVL